MSIKDDFENGDGDYGAITADFESMGYQLAGSIEFYDCPETGTIAFRSVAFSNDAVVNLQDQETMTGGQQALLIAQGLFEDYLDSQED